MSHACCRAWLCLGLVAVGGCEAELTSATQSRAAAGSGGLNSADAGAPEVDSGSSERSNPYSSSSGWVIDVSDAGWQDAEPPSCGASSFEAERVVVETMVEIPEEITEDITEEVPEEITEEVTEEVTTVKPTVLYLMFDQSLSMAGGLLFGANKWDPAVKALKSFVDDPASAGLGVALQYFPSSGGSCSDGSGYSTPAVSVGLLPERASVIGSSLDQHSPAGVGTPIEGALRGATEFCKQYQADHSDEQCVSVLVTDGKAELAAGCEENADKLAAIAKAAHDEGVITFAVGLAGANFGLLDKIAQQGGAPDCDASSSSYACDVSAGAEQLSDALNTIREKVVTTETHAVTHTVTRTVTRTVTKTVTRTEVVQQVHQTSLPCEWTIPQSPDGETFDRDKVNIRLSTDDEDTTFVRVDSAAQCQAGAWYFDDPAAPTRLIACEQTCQQLENVTDARIDILLGCATITPG